MAAGPGTSRLHRSRGRAALAVTLEARDPAHERLASAVAVTAGVVISVLFAQTVIHVLHGESDLLAMAIFLAVQAGSMALDASARARLVTTALMVPVLAAVIVAAALLIPYSALLVACFIAIAGIGIWVRKFGVRASALGSFAFMGYFFPLFMKPSAAELPAFVIIAVGAVVAQLIMRAILLLRRPRRTLGVLLRELRAESAAAMRVAEAALSHRAHDDRALRTAFARIDDVARAITSWQGLHPTERHVAIDEQGLAERVLDARADTEEAGYLLAREDPADDATPGVAASRVRAQRALGVVLDERAPEYRLDAARDTARELTDGRAPSALDVETFIVARSALSHARLRDVDLTRPLPDRPASTSRGSTPPSARSGERGQAPPAPRRRRVRRREWAPTTRMAVQSMIAAALAAGIGEAISASRWYWAVMTTFVVFIGANTRGTILTRAAQRIAGTAAGIAVGIAAVAFAGDDTTVLVAVCVVAVFGILYFGPLSYLYYAAFITLMLVALYRLLGVLHGPILEVRLVETVSGSVIGVLCAYLILSSTSRPVLLSTVDAYFDALDALLAAVGRADDRAELLADLNALETAHVDLEKALAAMSAAIVVSGPRRESGVVHSMYVAGRACARLVEARLRLRTGDRLDGTIRAAVDDVRSSVLMARCALHGGTTRQSSETPESDDGPGVSPDGSQVIERLRGVPTADVDTRDAIVALARIDWALRRVSGG